MVPKYFYIANASDCKLKKKNLRIFKGAVMQIEKALINDGLRNSKVS